MAITLNSFTAGQVIVAADMNTNFNNINSWSDTVALKAGAAFTGNVTITSGTFTVGANTAGDDVKFFGDTSGAYMLWDADTDDLILAGAARVVVPDGQLVLGSTAVTSTAAELNILDGVTADASEINFLDGSTAGTVVASKALVADSNVDVSSAGHFVAQSGGADSGIVMGQTFSASYVGLRTAGMSETSGDEYVIMSNGTTTFLSAGTDGDVVICGGPNNTSCRVKLDTSENQIDVTGAFTVSGATTVSGLLTANGSLTIQNGDTFTFNNVGLTSVIDSTETWASNNTSIATTGAIAGLGYKKITIQADAPSGVEGDIWIDT